MGNKTKALCLILQPELEPPSFLVWPKCPISIANAVEQRSGCRASGAVPGPPFCSSLSSPQSHGNPRQGSICTHTRRARSPRPPAALPHSAQHPNAPWLSTSGSHRTIPPTLPRIESEPAHIKKAFSWRSALGRF